MLLKLLLADADDLAVGREDDGAGGGRALVDGENGGGHVDFLFIGPGSVQAGPNFNRVSNALRRKPRVKGASTNRLSAAPRPRFGSGRAALLRLGEGEHVGFQGGEIARRQREFRHHRVRGDEHGRQARGAQAGLRGECCERWRIG